MNFMSLLACMVHTDALMKVSDVFSKKLGVDQVVVTSAAERFVKEADLLEENVPMHTNDKEWGAWEKLGDPVLHIDLRSWADLFLIAPLSANSLAKFAQVNQHLYQGYYCAIYAYCLVLLATSHQEDETYSLIKHWST